MATLNGLSSSSMSKKRKLESTPNDHIGPKQTMTERTLTTTVTGQQQRSTSTRSAGEMFAGGVGKGGEGARGRLWVCDVRVSPPFSTHPIVRLISLIWYPNSCVSSICAREMGGNDISSVSPPDPRYAGLHCYTECFPVSDNMWYDAAAWKKSLSKRQLYNMGSRRSFSFCKSIKPFTHHRNGN